MDRIFSRKNSTIYSEFFIKNWDDIPMEKLSAYVAFSILDEFDGKYLRLILMRDSENDDEILSDFLKILEDNGFKEVPEIPRESVNKEIIS